MTPAKLSVDDLGPEDRARVLEGAVQTCEFLPCVTVKTKLGCSVYLCGEPQLGDVSVGGGDQARHRTTISLCEKHALVLAGSILARATSPVVEQISQPGK